MPRGREHLGRVSAADAVFAVDEPRTAVVGQHRRSGGDDVDGEKTRAREVSQARVFVGRPDVDDGHGVGGQEPRRLGVVDQPPR